MGECSDAVKEAGWYLASEARTRSRFVGRKGALSDLRHRQLQPGAGEGRTVNETVETSTGSDPRIGSTIAGYRIERLLGRGGMGTVYLAEDIALGRSVALKLLSERLSHDEAFRERIRIESRLAASIDHPNVIPIYEAGQASEATLFIAMRYVKGSDLKQILRSEGALEQERAIELLAQVAKGLDAAHARGLIHRDVKPSNVLVAVGDDGSEHVYLADFGLTQTFDSPEAARREHHSFRIERLRESRADPRNAR